MKNCRTCKQSKPKTEFWLQDRRTGLLQGECKICMRYRNNAWQRQNKLISEERVMKNNELTKRKRKYNPAKSWYFGTKARAKKGNLVFELAPEDFIIPVTCPVLGIPIESRMGYGKVGGRHDGSPSVDRIDNSEGYTPENTIIVSFRVNRLKSDASIEELRKIVEFYDVELRRRG